MPESNMDTDCPVSTSGFKEKDQENHQKKKRLKFSKRKIPYLPLKCFGNDFGSVMMMFISPKSQVKMLLRQQKQLLKGQKQLLERQEGTNCTLTQLMSILVNRNGTSQYQFQGNITNLQICADGTNTMEIDQPDRTVTAVPGTPPPRPDMWMPVEMDRSSGSADSDHEDVDEPNDMSDCSGVSSSDAECQTDQDCCSKSNSEGDLYDVDSDVLYSDTDVDQSDQDYFDERYGFSENDCYNDGSRSFDLDEVHDIDDGGIICGLPKSPGEGSEDGHSVKSNVSECLDQGQGPERSEGTKTVETPKGLDVSGSVTDQEWVDGSDAVHLKKSDASCGSVVLDTDIKAETSIGSVVSDTASKTEMSIGSVVSDTDTKTETSIGSVVSDTASKTEMSIGSDVSKTDTKVETNIGLVVSGTDTKARMSTGSVVSYTDTKAEMSIGSVVSDTNNIKIETSAGSVVASIDKNPETDGGFAISETHTDTDLETDGVFGMSGTVTNPEMPKSGTNSQTGSKSGLSECDTILESYTGIGVPEGVPDLKGTSTFVPDCQVSSERAVRFYGDGRYFGSNINSAAVGSVASANPRHIKEQITGPSQAVFRSTACMEENQCHPWLVLSPCNSNPERNKKQSCPGLCVRISKGKITCSGDSSENPCLKQLALPSQKNGQVSGCERGLSQSAVSLPPVGIGDGNSKLEGSSSAVLAFPVQVADGIPVNDRSPSNDVLPFPVQAAHLSRPVQAVADTWMSFVQPEWFG